MNDHQQRQELLEEISKTGLIPNLKAQIRHNVKERLLAKVPIPKFRSKSVDSELANNIILEYLLSAGFAHTASVFYSEASINQISRSTILTQLNIKDCPGMIAELLLDTNSTPSVSTQTENIDLNSRLDAIDKEIKRRRIEGRLISSEEMLRKGIEDIDRETEEKFNSEVCKQMEIFKAGELMQTIIKETNSKEQRLKSQKIQLDSDFKQKVADVMFQFEKDSEVLKSKRRELEHEIVTWAEKNISQIKEDSSNFELKRIRSETEQKAKLIQQKTKILLTKLEHDRRKLEDIQFEHNKAKREVEKLRTSIDLYEQTQNL